MFTLRNVRYRKILAIDELVIPPDRCTCILGESGSGKTTLLRLLNSLISADSGDVLYNGESVENLNPVELRRSVVMLPQTPVIFPGTVGDNLVIGCELAGRPVPTPARQKDTLNLVRLNKSLDEPAQTLSGGEKQRLGLARILLMEPSVLLLDEPSSALDEDTEKLVIGGVVDYAKANGETLIMVTHTRQVAHDYGDMVVTLKDGRVVGVEGALQ